MRLLLTISLLLAAAASAQDSKPAAQNAAPPAAGKDGKKLFAPHHAVLPTNQILSPAGVQVPLPGVRPLALALSPDGRLLVTAGNSKKLLVLNAESGALLQELTFPPDAGKPSGDKKSETQLGPAPGSQESLTGLVFSPDGSRIYLSNVFGNIKVFAVSPEHQVTALTTFAIPEARTARRKMEVPAGLALSADGKKLYVAGNVANRLHELDAAAGTVLRSWDTGVAPFDVVIAGDKAYVSNSGGRRPGKDDVTAPAGAGTKVRVDAQRHIASEGTVTVASLAGQRARRDEDHHIRIPRGAR